MCFLNKGDSVLVTDALYNPTRNFCEKILVKYEGNNFLLNFDKTIFSKNIKNNEVVSLAKEVSIEFLENSNSFSIQEWKELYKLSEKTFVEETESSKKIGAGAGLTDND